MIKNKFLSPPRRRNQVPHQQPIRIKPIAKKTRRLLPLINSNPTIAGLNNSFAHPPSVKSQKRSIDSTSNSKNKSQFSPANLRPQLENSQNSDVDFLRKFCDKLMKDQAKLRRKLRSQESIIKRFEGPKQPVSTESYSKSIDNSRTDTPSQSVPKRKQKPNKDDSMFQVTFSAQISPKKQEENESFSFKPSETRNFSREAIKCYKIRAKPKFRRFPQDFFATSKNPKLTWNS